MSVRIGDTVYSVEDALTVGVTKKRLEFWSQIHDTDIFETREEALKRADDLRKNKIASLKSQIDKLEKMEFT